jgi:PTS system beta-glucosides-specific IIC component
VIIVPLTFLIVGPAFGVVGLGIQTAASALAEWQFIGPILLGLIMGGFYQVLVIFGLHWAIVPILFMEISQVNPVWNAGVTTVTAYNQIAVIAQVGAVFAIALRVRNPARKSAAIAAGITGIFGITEPVIYGFTLPKKTPFFFACLSGAVFGALAGFAGNFISNGHGIAWQFGGTGIFTYPAYLIPGFDGSVANLLIVLAASIFSVGTAFVLTYATYKPDAAEMDTGEVVIDTSRVDKTSAKKVFAPVKRSLL